MAKPLGERAARKQRSRERNERETRPARRRAGLRKTLWISGVAVVLAGAVFGIVFAFVSAKTLPPTDWSPGTHPETWPPSQILSYPISYGEQQHIMEHDRDREVPGIIAQYNCSKYTCANDLVPKLREVVEQYTSRVYLAPYPQMDAKIALTTYKKRDVLDDLDETRIVQFIDDAFR